MKELNKFRKFLNEGEEIRESFKDKMLSFLPPRFRKEMSFIEGMDALFGLTNDYEYVIKAMRMHLKNLERNAGIEMDDDAYEVFLNQLGELEMTIQDVMKKLEKLDKWKYGSFGTSK